MTGVMLLVLSINRLIFDLISLPKPSKAYTFKFSSSSLQWAEEDDTRANILKDAI